MNKKAQVQWFFDFALAMLIIGAYSMVTLAGFYGQTSQIEGRIVDFGQVLDSQTFLQGLFATDVIIDNFNGNVADVFALSVHTAEYDDYLSNLFKQKLDSKYQVGGWEIVIRSADYEKTYGTLYLAELRRDLESGVVQLSSKVSDPFGLIIPENVGDYFKLKVWPFKTNIPGLDGQNIEVLLRIKKDE
ncbi:MAG: hypothetical protein U9R08_05530 [Nanoarchaeota archaeon]|nr:hypothetical protein [Nanoarchaeota archaeon]